MAPGRRSKEWTAALAAAALAVLVGLVAPAGAGPLAERVGPIAMTVSDADRSAAFYATVLGFEKVSDLSRRRSDELVPAGA